VKTSRNGVLLNALLEVGFIQTETRDAGSMLVLDCKAKPPASDIVSIAVRSLKLQFRSLSSVQLQERCVDGVEETRPVAS
jgi:hypothetical protein